MPTKQETVDYILDQLPRMRGVSARKIFGDTHSMLKALYIKMALDISLSHEFPTHRLFPCVTMESMRRLHLISVALIEFIPIIAALMAFPHFGFSGAVTALIMATVVSLVLSLFIDKRVPRFGLFSAILVVVLGALTLISNNPDYIIVLDTFGSLGFALLLLGGRWRGLLFLKIFFERYFAITEKGWRILTVRWALFFIFFAGINEYVRLFRTPEEWVYWNAFGALAAIVFGMYQFTLSRRERLPEANVWGLRMQ